MIATGYFDGAPIEKKYSYNYFDDPDKSGYFSAINNFSFALRCGNDDDTMQTQRSRILKDFHIKNQFDSQTGTFSYDVFYKCVDVNPTIVTRVDIHNEKDINVTNKDEGGLKSMFVIDRLPEDEQEKLALLKQGATNILFPVEDTSIGQNYLVSNLMQRREFRVVNNDKLYMKNIYDPAVVIANPALDGFLQIQMGLALQHITDQVDVLEGIDMKKVTEDAIKSTYKSDKVKYNDGPEIYAMYPAMFTAFDESNKASVGFNGFLQNVYPTFDSTTNKLSYWKVYKNLDGAQSAKRAN